MCVFFAALLVLILLRFIWNYQSHGLNTELRVADKTKGPRPSRDTLTFREALTSMSVAFAGGWPIAKSIKNISAILVAAFLPNTYKKSCRTQPHHFENSFFNDFPAFSVGSYRHRLLGFEKPCPT